MHPVYSLCIGFRFIGLYGQRNVPFVAIGQQNIIELNHAHIFSTHTYLHVSYLYTSYIADKFNYLSRIIVIQNASV